MLPDALRAWPAEAHVRLRIAQAGADLEIVRATRAGQAGLAARVHGGLQLVYLPVADVGDDAPKVPQPPHAPL